MEVNEDEYKSAAKRNEGKALGVISDKTGLLFHIHSSINKTNKMII